MDRRDAQGLTKLLADAFRKQLEPGTIEIYVAAFERLQSVESAFATVREIIDGAEHFPSVAAIRSGYLRKRTLELDHDQRLALEAEETGVREVPAAVMDVLTKLRERSKDVHNDAAAVLPEADAGSCDDCGSNFERRYLYGAFQLCGGCASKRLALREVG